MKNATINPTGPRACKNENNKPPINEAPEKVSALFLGIKNISKKCVKKKTIPNPNAPIQNVSNPHKKPTCWHKTSKYFTK